MSFLTGKPASSESSNLAYPWLKDQFGGMVDTGNDASGQMAALLGLGGDTDAAEGAYGNFLNSTGYNNIFDQAMRGVTGSAAARGLLKSGSTAKALQDRAAGLGQQYFTNYLGQLGGLAGQGLQAGGLIGNAGQVSKNRGGTSGLGGLIGGGLSMFAGL
jgi:hypothetical protein